MNHLRQLIELGVTPETSATEARRIRFTNALALLALLLIIGSYHFVHGTLEGSALAIIATILMLSVLALDAAGRVHAAGSLLCAAVLGITTAQTLNLGVAAGLQFYLLPLCFLPYFVFPRQHLRLALGFSCIAGVVFIAIPWSVDPTTESTVDPNFYIYSVSTVAVIASIIGGYARALARASESQISRERAANEKLLRDALPTRFASRLLEGEPCTIEFHANAAVVYADIVGFTPLSESMAPERVVGLLDELVTAFDHVCVTHNIEKLKTLGDAYIAAAGVAGDTSDVASRAVAAASGFIDVSRAIRVQRGIELWLRVGVACGTVAAGLVGKRRFGLDLWGEALVRAEELQRDGIIDAVIVDEATRLRAGAEFHFCARSDGTFRFTTVAPPRNEDK